MNKITFFKNAIFTMVFFFTITLSAQIEPGTTMSNNSKSSKTSKSTTASKSTNNLSPLYSVTGQYFLSADGVGSKSSSMHVLINKPSNVATVHKAFLFSVTIPYGSAVTNGCVTINGSAVNWDGSIIKPAADYNNHWADVTSLVSSSIDGMPAGLSTLPITECNGHIDGNVLLVIFNENIGDDETVAILWGAQNSAGDSFNISLNEPIDPTDPESVLDMGIGISFGYQGSSQYSIIDVNGTRLTTSAGGQDDGAAANGALITVGGIGDSNANPPDSYALATNTHSDDELYSLLPFIDNETTSLTAFTQNPSNNDNIFLAYFVISGSASVSSVCPETITVDTEYGTCGATVNYVVPEGSLQTVGLPSGSVFPVGTTINTFTNPECSFNVTVIDNSAPTAITQDITVTLDEYGNATITPEDVDNNSFDNCTFTASLDVTTFDCTNIGLENTVTLTVTDASGNSDATTATVTILESFKETLDLRAIASFEAYTGTGAVTNSGTFTGNVGTNAGALTGFTGPNFNGNIHHNDALTAQGKLDLMKVYIHLNNIFVTHPGTHAPAFGSGETLTPGVYDIGGAGSVAGTLYLDGQGDPNALFIMKFKGAFTAGVGSNIILTNGANAANVFWVAQGALSVGANSTIKGTLLAYPGAITLGINSSIEGRLISSVGAITVGAGASAMMPDAMNIPINPMVSYTPAPAVDVLGTIENFSLFSSIGAVANASFSGIIGDIGADIGAISGFATSAHIGSFYNTDAVTAQAKIDLNYAYNQLMMIPTTVSSHAPAFGSGETLQPGVYSTPGAGSLAGTIILDGQNDPDAIFIFKFNGAFSVGAQSKVILSNGTRRCNVFWISEGAASIGTFSTLKGTILAHNGAATMGAGGNLEGRLLSTGGAIGFSTGVVYTVVHDVECIDDTNSKTSTKKIVKATSDAKSIEENLIIYPNPSNGVFNIKLAEVNLKTDVILFDTTGKLIQRKSFSKEENNGNSVEIGNYNLASGIYVLKIITNNKTITKKMIVE